MSSTATGVPLNPGAPTYSWLFDESGGATATAHTGGVNGTLENGATRVSDTPFAYAGNQSISLTNNTGSDVNFGTHSGFEFVNTTFTVSAWIKVPAATAGTRMMVFNKGNAGPSDPDNWAYHLEIRSNSGSPLGGGPETGSSEAHFEFQNSGSPVNDDTWHHVAAIISTIDANGPGGGAAAGGGDVRLFLDGVELSTTLLQDTFQQNVPPPNTYNGAPNAALRLGARGSTGGGTGTPNTGLTGLSDEFALFNRALSEDEILWLSQNSISQIPEPATASLAGLGAILCLQRRSRVRR